MKDTSDELVKGPIIAKSMIDPGGRYDIALRENNLKDNQDCIINIHDTTYDALCHLV